ncbi:MAG TPA: aminodeoxychorismate synthase component I [Myxococcota bacterium]|nr:aminodeoxychorismate synthase component I [Myxococcota bacterium]
MRSHTALAVRELAPPPGGLFPRFARLRGEPYPWLLESARVDGRLGRFSFAGADPYLVLRVFGRESVLELRRDVRPDLRGMPTLFRGDPLELVRALMPARPMSAGPPDMPPFVGGAIGFFGHELASQIENLAFHGRDELGLPDLCLLFVDRLLGFDHICGRCFALGVGFGVNPDQAQKHADQAACAIAKASVPRVAPAASDSEHACVAAESLVVSPLFDESTYGKHVVTVKEHIGAGDVYQVCLTHRLEVPFAGDPFAIYTKLRRSNPSPFAAYLELPEVAIVGSSPERFLRLTIDRHVESRPIKGTRPRGASASQDAHLRAELLGSEKDRAENVMIVDLVRNDLGRVCETGSIAVSELCVVEDHASVFQLVSTVIGRLREDRDLVDLLRCSFPPGSMTGAPKLAALRILDQLEPVRRGPYAGALGYLDLRGGADLCVVIRTLLVQGGRAFIHTGGGIVADSDPAAEWREAQDKVRVLLAAVARASAAGRRVAKV